MEGTLQPGLRLAVTTSGAPTPALVARAREKARAWGLPFLQRAKKEPLTPWFGTRADGLLVFQREGVELWDAHGHFGFHPGMAHLRRMRLDAGEGDTLVSLAELVPGDTVLDCTLGLAQDALTAARAVGPGGRVFGLERSLALYAVVSEGLAAYAHGPRACAVEAAHGDAEAFLAGQADASWDVVLLDPMFERPEKAQPSFEVLRRFAHHVPLERPLLKAAQRVARRWVVVKGGRKSSDFARLGLVTEPVSRHASVRWARLPGSPGSAV